MLTKGGFTRSGPKHPRSVPQSSPLQSGSLPMALLPFLNQKLSETFSFLLHCVHLLSITQAVSSYKDCHQQRRQHREMLSLLSRSDHTSGAYACTQYETPGYKITFISCKFSLISSSEGENIRCCAVTGCPASCPPQRGQVAVGTHRRH